MPELTVTGAPEDESCAVITDGSCAVITDGLAAFHNEKTGDPDYQPLAVLVSDPDTGFVLGGLLGKTYLGLFVIERLFLPQWLRGKGLGSRVLALSEKAARERGCAQAAAIMVSFQAPPFFLKRGYDMFAQLYCAKVGPTHFFMAKDLSRPDGQRGRIR